MKRYCVMVAQQTLTLFVWVQILVPLPTGQGPGAYVCPRPLFFMPAGKKTGAAARCGSVW